MACMTSREALFIYVRLTGIYWVTGLNDLNLFACLKDARLMGCITKYKNFVAALLYPLM